MRNYVFPRQDQQSVKVEHGSPRYLNSDLYVDQEQSQIIRSSTGAENQNLISMEDMKRVNKILNSSQEENNEDAFVSQRITKTSIQTDID